MQVSSQCRYPMHANGEGLFCVTSYSLKYLTEDAEAWTPYKENDMTKVKQIMHEFHCFMCNNMFTGLPSVLLS